MKIIVRFRIHAVDHLTMKVVIDIKIIIINFINIEKSKIKISLFFSIECLKNKERKILDYFIINFNEYFFKASNTPPEGRYIYLMVIPSETKAKDESKHCQHSV
jgi:hypothetical protein